MYKVYFYQSASGNTPFESYIQQLSNKRKEEEIFHILIYLEKLKEFGFAMNEKFRPNAFKKIRDGIYELRPSSSRIFFFAYVNDTFVILHGWEKKRQKTDPKEIEKAVKEKNRYLKEQQNARSN